MAPQVSTGSLLLALLIGALVSAGLVAGVAHGLLRTFMHARGVSPWTLRDTLGSGMLLIFGAMCFGAAIALVVLTLAGAPSSNRMFISIAVALVLTGSAFVRFGLLSLRKLT